MGKGFVVNAHRFDPYKNYKFRVLKGGKTVLGVSKVSALKRTTDLGNRVAHFPPAPQLGSIVSVDLTPLSLLRHRRSA